MNSAFTVLYRDTDNYKACHEVVLNGLITEALYQQLKDALPDGAFVPNELGIENPALSFMGMDRFPNPDCDHGFCTLSEIEYGEDFHKYMQLCKTAKKPTVDMTPAAFVKAIIDSPKDAVREFNRLAELAEVHAHNKGESHHG